MSSSAKEGNTDWVLQLIGQYGVLVVASKFWGRYALVVLTLLADLYLFFRWRQKRRLERELARPRNSLDESGLCATHR